MKNFLTLLLLLLFATVLSSSAQPQPVAAETWPGNPGATGYMGSAELGFLYGKTNNSSSNMPLYLATPSVQFFNGYRVHRLFAIGGTVGLDFYENILITPLALGIRGEMFSTRVSPFYSLDVGYGSAFMSSKHAGYKPEGGWLFSPALGVRVKTGNNTAYTFGLGYKQQRVDTEAPGWGGIQINQKITYKRLSVRMGFMF